MDWKISPQVQAERDRLREEVLRLEATNPEYANPVSVLDPRNARPTRDLSTPPEQEVSRQLTLAKAGQDSGYVTDPAILAKLNGPSNGEENDGLVTDPNLLAKLNGTAPPADPNVIEQYEGRNIDPELAKTMGADKPWSLKEAAGIPLGIAETVASMVPAIAGQVGAGVAAIHQTAQDALMKAIGRESTMPRVDPVIVKEILSDNELFYPETRAGKEISEAIGNVLKGSQHVLHKGADQIGDTFDLPHEAKGVLHAAAESIPEMVMTVSMLHKAGPSNKLATAANSFDRAREGVTEASKRAVEPPKPTSVGEVGKTPDMIGNDVLVPDPMNPPYAERAPGTIRGGAGGGIPEGTKLAMDENGMPYDPRLTQDMLTEQQRSVDQQAGARNMETQGDLFPPEPGTPDFGAWVKRNFQSEKVAEMPEGTFPNEGPVPPPKRTGVSMPKEKSAMAQAFDTAMSNLFGGPRQNRQRGSTNMTSGVVGDIGEAIRDRLNPEAMDHDTALNNLLKVGREKFGFGEQQTLQMAKWLDDHNTNLTSMIMGRMDMPLMDFLEFTKNFNFKDAKDMPVQKGGSTASFRATNPLIGDLKNAYAWIQKYTDDHLQLAKELEHSLNDYGNRAAWEEYNRYYGLDKNVYVRKALGPTGLIKGDRVELFKKDIGIALEMERNPEAWGGGPDKMVPTVEDLQRAGMSDASAVMWNKVHQVMDFQWKILTDAAIVNGRAVPKRIPGYLSHVVKGPYRTQIYREIEAPDGTTKREYLWNSGHYSRQEAAAVQRRLENIVNNNSEFSGWTVGKDLPKAKQENIGSMLEGLDAARNMLDNNTGLVKLLTNLYEGASQGIVTHALNRANLEVRGHTLERAAMPTSGKGLPNSWITNLFKEEHDASLSARQVMKAAQTMQETAQAINGWYVRSKFVNDTLFPMEMMGVFKEAPQMRQNIDGYLHAFFKVGSMENGAISSWMRSQYIKMGIDPNTTNRIITTMHSGLSKYFLWAKPSFYLANSAQQLQGVPYLYTVKALSEALGEKSGNIGKALADAFPEGLESFKHKSNSQLMEYARNHGHVDPSFMDAVDPGALKDPFSVAIERNTRANSFLLGYHYYKQIMPKDQALKAAGKFSDTISVPYSTDVGAPIITSTGGAGGRAMSMFTTYNFHQMGLLAQQQRILAMTGKSGTAAAHAMMGSMGMLATLGTLFGVMGLPFVANYDDIVRFLGQKFGVNMPTAREGVKSLLKDHDELQKLVGYGLPSYITGFDISSSGSGPSVQAPTAFLSGIGYGGTGLYLLARSLMGPDKAPSQREVKQWINQQPPQWRPYYETFATKDNPWAVIFNDKDTGIIPLHSDPNMKINDRTAGDAWAHLVGGVSVNEAQQRDAVSIAERQKSVDTTNVGWMLQSLKEGNLPQEQKQQILNQLMTRYWTDPNTVINDLISYQVQKNMTYEQRKAQAAINSTQAAKWFLDWQRLNAPKK